MSIALDYCLVLNRWQLINTLKPKQNGRHLADDIIKCIFFNENFWILKISIKQVTYAVIDNKPTFVQIIACCQASDNPLYENHS